MAADAPLADGVVDAVGMADGPEVIAVLEMEEVAVLEGEDEVVLHTTAVGRSVAPTSAQKFRASVAAFS